MRGLLFEGDRSAACNGRRGFYFSFDALLALSVVAATSVFLVSASTPTDTSLDATVASYRTTNAFAEDAAQLATRNAVRQAFPQGWVDDWVATTELEDGDRSKPVLDVIAILWASNESATARNLSEAYFNETIPAEYEYRVSIFEDTRNVLYNTSFKGSPAFVANAKRVVSGVQKNRPSEGYIARARATEVSKNESRVLTFSPMGTGLEGGKIRVTKHFEVNDTRDVVNATFYLSVHYGCSNAQFENFFINGNNIKSEIEWIHQRGDCDSTKTGTGAYGVIRNFHDYVVNGTNTMYMRFRNNDYHAHTHPGMKIEMELTGQEQEEVEGHVRSETVPFDAVNTTEHANDNAGVFAVKPFSIPRNATIRNVFVHLEAEDIDGVYNDTADTCGTPDGTVSDVMVLFNGEEVYEEGLPDGSHDVTVDLNLTETATDETNVVAAYFNMFGDCFWGSDETRLVSPAGDLAGSYINVTYEIPRDSLVFGKIRLTRNEQIGGAVENPKVFNKSFNGSSVLSSFLHVAQLLSDRVTVNVTDADGNEETPFESVGSRSVPSDIFIDPFYYTLTGNNTIHMEDETPDYDFVPESSLEYTQLVDSQVPYGGTFPNGSAALDDAEQRLNQTLGPFVDSTQITSTTLSVNNVPWLFGPVTLEVEVWKP